MNAGPQNTGGRWERTLGHRKLDVKELFCLCGFAFLGFLLWVSLVPVTASPLNPMVGHAMRVGSLRNRLIQLRKMNYEKSGDYAEAVLAVAPDIESLEQVVHQTTEGWAILANDPEYRQGAQQVQVGLGSMQEQARILNDEVIVARMMQQATPLQRQELNRELLRLISQEQISRERLQEYHVRPGI